MVEIRPQKFRWTGDAMKPIVPSAAADMYEKGRTYWLEPWVPASSASRSHYFAAIKDAWDSLPEHTSDRFPTPEHLRKFCLIRTGYRDERTIAAASKDAVLGTLSEMIGVERPALEANAGKAA